MAASSEPTAAPRAIAMAAAAVLLFGVVLRLLGMFSLELWSDEARWCQHLLTGTGAWFRPIGYMWLTRQLLEIDINEPLLRSLSTVAGLAQLPLVYLALRYLVQRPLIAVVGTWLLAIHPVAVAMSKEFKPYAVEAMLHSALVAFALLYLRNKSPRWLAAVLTTAVVAPFFAWTVVFAYPGLFVVVGLDALREKRKGHLGATALACVATLGVLVAMFFARLAAKKLATQYWGNKYDVFYVDDGGVLGHVRWFFENTAELLAFPAALQMPWPPAVVLTVKVACVALCVLGAVALVVRKQWRAAGLLLVPWLPMVVFNAVGAWPYGLFRTNTFMLFYTLMLVAIGVDFLAELVARLPALQRRAAATLGVLALVVTFPFELGAFAHKGKGTLTSESSVLAALRRVYQAETSLPFDAPLDAATKAERATVAAKRANASARELAALDDDAGLTTPLLVLDGHACTTVRYYRDYDSGSSVLRDWLPSHFSTLCGSYRWKGWKSTLTDVRGRSFWLISAKSDWPDATRKRLAPYCEALVDEVLPPSTHLYRCRARSDLPPPPREPASKASVTPAAEESAPGASDAPNDVTDQPDADP